MNTKNHISLDDFSKRNAFKTPEGYFEAFPEKMMAKIASEKSKGKDKKLVTFIRPALTLAASMIGFMLISYFIMKKFVPEKSSYNSAMTAFVKSHVFDVDEELLWNEATKTPLDNNEEFENAIVEYLSYEDDINLFINEL